MTQRGPYWVVTKIAVSQLRLIVAGLIVAAQYFFLLQIGLFCIHCWNQFNHCLETS